MAAPDTSQEPRPSEGSWLLRIYELISVSPADILADAKGLGIQITSIDELRSVRTSVLDGLADQYIRNAKLMTSLSGAGLGAGGLLMAGPEISILAANILRMAQRLSIVYGFDYQRPGEALHVWASIARSLGVEKVSDGASNIAVRNLPKLLASGARTEAFKSLIKLIAARLGLLVTERGLARALPLVGAAVAGVTNFQLVRDVGGKIQAYFRERHITERVSRDGLSARGGERRRDPVPDDNFGPGAPDASGKKKASRPAKSKAKRKAPKPAKSKARSASKAKPRKAAKKAAKTAVKRAAKTATSRKKR